MIHIREEGENIQTGFNFYPKGSNQVGVVIRFGDLVLFARYNRHLGKFKFHGVKA
ncbi:hypothetical protein UFOVP908_63 [uncultured Caudovirales phage]|uniref:Uncharacterized protein n=1 Tax=uncultured Caudovirales phage TaxID=2100421 RepID=A0A6J5R7L4_9CAUD|nr:hypothetical protein UFOVP908_63 [uncultured Caudovirales phage]CAB4176848.1 hypothetical protein UFOVP990_73 [uncultured Caudovirales phage]CAB4182000.1 hypothetical protein UFOVP1065_104 [uncultured Caudovirales phage]CAB4190586.1 hypothetical protein UFOVP1198_73 [uncultured Caudovirales phage]CAB4211019.1 hypothetical protein UFOVP1418_65 [uncultured Caudovirales phage]